MPLRLQKPCKKRAFDVRNLVRKRLIASTTGVSYEETFFVVMKDACDSSNTSNKNSSTYDPMMNT